MSSLLNKSNYENTILEDVNFQFNIFFITQTTIPHWHKHTELIYVLAGSVSIYINGALFVAIAGDIVFVPRDSLHSIIPKGNSRYCAILIGNTLFNYNLLDNHFKEIIYYYIYSIDNHAFLISQKHEHYILFKNIIEEILQEVKEKIDGYHIVIKGCICKFFVLVSRYIQYEKYDFNYNWEYVESLKKVFDLASKNYNTKITISEMALLTNYSKQHFCRIFKAYTGKTFIEYITLMRLEHAENLMVKTNLSITEISKITGFCTVNYFNRIFKKYKEQNPSEVRKSLKKFMA